MKTKHRDYDSWCEDVIGRLTKLETLFTNHLEHHKSTEKINFRLYCIILVCILGVLAKVYL